MTVPYSFANATVSIPLSQLDANFNTAITLGNTAIQLGNTVTTLNNMTLANVTISSGNVTITNVTVTTANVTTVNASTVIATTANVTTANITTGNVTNMSSGNVTITGGSINGTTLGASTASTANVTTLTTSSTVTLNGGTANPLPYLDGSKVLTTGSALTFDGATLAAYTTGGAIRKGNAGATVYTNLAEDGVYAVNTDLYLLAPTGKFMSFYANNSEQMRLTSTGLGIGTSSPAYKLDVSAGSGTGIRLKSTGAYGTIRADNTGTTGGGVFAAYQNGVQVALFGVDGGILGNTSTDTAIFSDVAGGGIKLYTNASPTPKATLDSSGNLGLGTTTPASFGKFAVRGAVNLATWGDTSGHFSDATTGSLYITHSSNKVALKTDADLELFCNNTGDSIIFSTNATERARITSGGNLLVGKTSSDLGTAGIEIFGAGYGQFTANNDASLFSNRLGSDGDTVKFYRATSLVGSISVTTSATAYNTSSDYRLKDNPQPLTGSGAFIDSLKPKTWNWKTDGSKGVGFIAHEVQEVSPASVTGEKDGEQMQAMEYGSAEFIANIIAELQSLRARVAQLEAK